jgi:hypothetical protein
MMRNLPRQSSQTLAMTLENEVYGEYPANISHVPGAIKFDDVAHQLLLAGEQQRTWRTFRKCAPRHAAWDRI